MLVKEAERAHRVAMESAPLPRVEMVDGVLKIVGGMTKPGAASKE